MDTLIKLLLHLMQKVPYLSEADYEADLDLLRAFESSQNVSGVVPPKAGPINAPVVPVEPPPVPGPVAEPVPADQQPPPVTSPELADAAPEESNAFADPTTAPPPV